MDEKSGYLQQQPPPSYEDALGKAHHQPPLPLVQNNQPQFHPIVYSRPPPTIVVSQAGPHPFMVTCPSCHQYVLTRMEYEPGTKTHLMAALLCLFGFFFCACLPYCIDSCMKGNHYCSNCGAYVGTYNT